MTAFTEDLIPRSWRWRVWAETAPDGSVALYSRRPEGRLAWITPDVEAGASRDTWVVADGNMVTRWYTFADAVLYAAQPRGEWHRPWPFALRQFWGDGLREPWLWMTVLAGSLATAVAALFGRSFLAAVGIGLAVFAAARCIAPSAPTPDHDQSAPEEVPGWPGDTRWSGLFATTVWVAGERPCPACAGIDVADGVACEECCGAGVVVFDAGDGWDEKVDRCS